MAFVTKYLGFKNYGSIGHLPNSRLGPSDSSVNDGMAKIIWEKPRDYKDTVIVQEKLDGSNVGVALINGTLVALSRRGYDVYDSPHLQHKLFGNWVFSQPERFLDLLKEGERVVGEWLALAHGTRYSLEGMSPFVAFDLMKGQERVPYLEFQRRVLKLGFSIPPLLSYGMPICHADILKRLGKNGHYGAIDLAEGYVCRVERENKVDFLAKFVRNEKVDGKYFDNETWNWKYDLLDEGE